MNNDFYGKQMKANLSPGPASLITAATLFLLAIAASAG